MDHHKETNSGHQKDWILHMDRTEACQWILRSSDSTGRLIRNLAGCFGLLARPEPVRALSAQP